MELPIKTVTDLERWLVAVGELNSAVGEEGVERHVAMTCQTDDPEREAAYLAFVRDIEPKLKPIQNAIRAATSMRPFDRSCRQTGISSSIVHSRTAAVCFAMQTSHARRNWPSLSSSTKKRSVP